MSRKISPGPAKGKAALCEQRGAWSVSKAVRNGYLAGEPHREAKAPGALSGPQVRRESDAATGVACRPEHTGMSRPESEMRPE